MGRLSFEMEWYYEHFVENGFSPEKARKLAREIVEAQRKRLEKQAREQREKKKKPKPPKRRPGGR